jgi:phosphohistidine phosphatase SixA
MAGMLHATASGLALWHSGAMLKLIFLLVCAALSLIMPASASELAVKLRAGDHVLLMRHAEAPGVGDPPNLRLGDCSTQRNLDSAGRQQARAVGVWLKQQGLTEAKVFTSPWCRCQDTARLLDLGQATIDPTLASFFNDPQRAAPTTTAWRDVVTKTLDGQKGKPVIMVTHHVNILDIVGENVASGEMVLARVDRQGRVLSYQRLQAPP